MKKSLFLIVLAFNAAQLFSQQSDGSAEDRNFRIPLIGEIAPTFTAESTNGTITFPDDFGRSWKILFSHPQDFTPVCSSEIVELARLQDQFDKLGVKIAVISTDRLDTHNQWKKSLESLDLDNKGKVTIKFPIIADANVEISKEYGMIHKESNSTRSVRGVFIIDPNNVIQSIYFYPTNVGRNTDELIRMVQALQVTASNKVLTPVNWHAGNDVLVPYPPDGTKQVSEQPGTDGMYAASWYMLYKKVK
ncbi:MAG TPA: redoxin domain-containing protein [Bacteroidales bacterium]|nr:redoxin domain-containing protein [Bacteroidales bacterium]